MPFGLGFAELMIILVIVTVVFGATRFPQIGDGLGKAIRNFKKSLDSSKSPTNDQQKPEIEDRAKPSA